MSRIRVKGTRRVLVAGLATVALSGMIAVGVAWATDLFADVPTASPHHDDVNAIAMAGVTGGCAPSLYCPDQPVRRDQMGSFLHRGLGRVAYSALAQNNVPNAETAVYSFTITPGLPVGALPGAAGFVKVDGKLNFTLTNGTNCPCDYLARLTSGGSPIDSSYSWITLYNTADVASIPLTGAFAVTTAGAKTISVNVFEYYGGGGGDGEATVSGDATATYFPFGGAGGNVLGGSVSAGAAAQQLQERSAAVKAARKNAKKPAGR